MPQQKENYVAEAIPVCWGGGSSGDNINGIVFGSDFIVCKQQLQKQLLNSTK